MRKILIIDDEPDIRGILSKVFSMANFSVVTAENGKQGLKKFQNKNPDVVILDMHLPDMHGLEVLGKIKKMDNSIPVIVLTAYGEISQAVRAVKMGAFDYLTKPVPNKKLILSVNHAIENLALKEQVKILKYQVGKIRQEEIIKGKSKNVVKIYNSLEKVSPTNLTVILEGETGTGKEIFANLIHLNSKMKDKQFIKIDIGAIPESLIESELFGYEAGAFTSAEKAKTGRIELAKGGTLFIDEITNIPINIQGKLLEVLEQGSFQHLGGKKKIFTDFRLLVACNVLLEKEVKQGRFRADLYHRLNQFTIKIPPLRERKEDISLFLEFFLKQGNRELKKEVKGFSHFAMNALLNYSWPGNIRELKNTIKRAVLLASDEVTVDCLPPQIEHPEEQAYGTGKSTCLAGRQEHTNSFKNKIEEVEKETIENLLKKYAGNKKKVAEELKIARKTLYNKIKKYKIEI